MIPTRQRSIRSTKSSRYTLVSVSAAAANALLYRLLLANLPSAALANFGEATMVVAGREAARLPAVLLGRSDGLAFRASAQLLWASVGSFDQQQVGGELIEFRTGIYEFLSLLLD